MLMQQPLPDEHRWLRSSSRMVPVEGSAGSGAGPKQMCTTPASFPSPQRLRRSSHSLGA